MHVTFAISHNLYGSITEKLQKYAVFKEELTSTWQMNAIYTNNTTCIIHKWYYAK